MSLLYFEGLNTTNQRYIFTVFVVQLIIVLKMDVGVRLIHCCVFGFGLWRLTPLSTIFQLYHGDQFS